MEDLIQIFYHLTPKVPNWAGIPCVVISFISGILQFIQGSIGGGLLSMMMSLLGVIYLYKKIQGQHLENKKRKLEIQKLTDESAKKDTKLIMVR